MTVSHSYPQYAPYINSMYCTFNINICVLSL